MERHSRSSAPLKIVFFLFLLFLPLSTVAADDTSTKSIVRDVGTGFSSQIHLTEQEQAWLNRRHTVRVRISEFPPHMMTLPEPRGISVDYLKLVGNRFGINFKFMPGAGVPWKEAVNDLEGDRKWFDLLITMKRTPEREGKIAFTHDYLFAPWVIVNRTNSPYVSRMDDLNDKSVAVERGYVIEGLIRDQFPRVKIVIVKNTLEALNSVASGIVDAYVGNLTVAAYFIQNGGLHNLKIAAPTPFGNHDQAMGVRSDWPELASIINKVLMAMPEAEKSGITSRWFAVKYDYGINLKKVFSWVVGPIAILSLIIVVTAIWNRRLRKEIDRRVEAEISLTEAKRQIAEREDELRTIIETEPECVKQMAQDGTLLQMNRAGLNMIEADTLEQVLGHKVQPLVLPEYRDALEDLIRRVFSGESGVLVFEIMGLKGGHRWLESHAVPFRNSENRIIALLSVTRDVTVRMRAEETRLRLEKHLVHAQKMESLGVLAGGIAHDFNNILTAVLGNTELALMEVDSASKVADHLHRIEQSSQRAADLAKQMLAYSGKGSFALKHLDVNQLLEETVQSLEGSLYGNAIRLCLTQPLDPIIADENQVKQAIISLVSNASEAFGAEKGKITVATGQGVYDSVLLQDFWIHEGLPGSTYVSIAVSDTGCGMDQETLARIFDPFFTTKFTGRGLGMAAVLGIVRGHKGTICVKSELGKGTTVTVLLPTGSQKAAIVERIETPKLPRQKRNAVLLVDDEESVRDLCSQMLKMLGYQVISASNGFDAVELFSRHGEIAFVILDLTMPVMGGEQVWLKLRAIDPSVKVIIASGYSEDDVAGLFAGKGIAGVLQKPFSSSSLSAAIQLLP